MLEALHAAARLCSLENPKHLDVGALTVPSSRRVTFCPNYTPRLVSSVLAAMRESSAAAPFETLACITVQSTVRMWLQRTVYRRLRRAVILIQCFYRGFRARKWFAKQLVEDEKAYQQAVFDYYATHIQACFRGYYCRKYHTNYYAMKKYIAKVVQESDRVQSLANSVQMELETLGQLEKNKADALAYRCATEKVHHVLSTEARPGVYNSGARSVTDGFQSDQENCISTTVWGTNVEDDIKANNSRLISAILLQRQKDNLNLLDSCREMKTKAKPNHIAGSAIYSEEAKKDERTLVLPVAGSDSCTKLEETGLSEKDDAENEQAARLHYYRQCFKPNTRLEELSCPYEREDTHPIARPLLVSRKSHLEKPMPSLPKTGSGGPKEGRFASLKKRAAYNALGKDFVPLDAQAENQFNLMTASSRLAPQNAVSSRNRKFRVLAHDCSRNFSKKDSRHNDVGDSVLHDKPIYDTEKEALQRIVDIQVINHLHGGVPFKVSAAVSSRPKLPSFRSRQKCSSSKPQ